MGRPTRFLLVLGIALQCITEVAVQAFAESITYTETAVASGSLGGIAFTNSLATLVAAADTNSVTTIPNLPFVVWAVDNQSATISIAGLGIATFTGHTLTYDNPGEPGNPERVGIEGGSVASTGFDILDVENSAFSSYRLNTPIGPLTGATSGGGGGVLFWGTTSGALTFDSFAGRTATFQAALRSSAVPESASLVMASLGLTAIVATAWWGRRH
jgi:hypothetical protein